MDFKKGFSALWTVPETKVELVIKLNEQSNLEKALTTASDSTICRGGPSTTSVSDFQMLVKGSFQVITDLWDFQGISDFFKRSQGFQRCFTSQWFWD